jgi:succinate dehydrogenase / fumarate reductase flavoprotein subunit
MIRTLQQRTVALGVDVFMECTITELLKDGERISGAFGYWRESGRFITFEAPTVILATGGIGKSFKVTSNSWEYTGDGHSLAMEAGAPLVNMEFVQFHPTGMVWPPSVRGILVTESVRGDGGVLRNSEGKRFMFDYIPEFFKAETAETEEEGDRWYDDHVNNRRPPELLPRDEVARAINSEIKAGRGSPHGGIFLDIASRRSAEFIQKRLPSMYHQFKELADVDITKEPMEIGPTCHYVMGGVEVDPDSQMSKVPGLYAAGEVGGGMHGANRLGGNSLGDLLVFGKRAGESAAAYAAALPERPTPSDEELAAAQEAALAPFAIEGGENPYTVQRDLQEAMHNLVGIIRTESEILQALETIESLKSRVARLSVEGHRQYNPGWHLSIDLKNMLRVSEAIARAALDRTESRGGHTRDDFPATDPQWGKINVLCRVNDDGTGVEVFHQDLPVMPDDLKALFEGSH